MAEQHSLGDRGMVYVDADGRAQAEVWEEYEPERRQKFDDDVCDATNEETDDWCRKTRAQHTVEAGGTGEDVDPEACEHFVPDLSNRKRFLVYQFDLEQHTPESVEGEWFADDLAGVASSCGTTREELVAGLCSADPLERFWAYDSIAGYHGYDNFDSYPLDLSERELEERQEADKKEERAAKQARHRVQVTAAAIEPHGRCQRAGKCVEHAADKRVPSCRGTGAVTPRGKGRKAP